MEALSLRKNDLHIQFMQQNFSDSAPFARYAIKFILNGEISARRRNGHLFVFRNPTDGRTGELRSLIRLI